MAKRRPRLTVREIPMVLNAARAEVRHLENDVRESWAGGTSHFDFIELAGRLHKARKRLEKLEKFSNEPAAKAVRSLNG